MLIHDGQNTVDMQCNMNYIGAMYVDLKINVTHAFPSPHQQTTEVLLMHKHNIDVDTDVIESAGTLLLHQFSSQYKHELRKICPKSRT